MIEKIETLKEMVRQRGFIGTERSLQIAFCMYENKKGMHPVSLQDYKWEVGGEPSKKLDQYSGFRVDFNIGRGGMLRNPIPLNHLCKYSTPWVNKNLEICLVKQGIDCKTETKATRGGGNIDPGSVDQYN